MEDGRRGPLQGNPHKSKAGLVRIWRALFYSLEGLRSAWRAEPAFRQEVFLAVVLIPAALLVPAALTQKAILVASVMLVLITELLNSAVESTVDRVSLEHHRLAKRAKDIGSAAVFVALLNLAIVWALVLADVFL
jgi:diacylglycerol kinase (ATP)